MWPSRSEEHTSELQSLTNLVCRLLLDTATTAIYTLSLHDALPISRPRSEEVSAAEHVRELVPPVLRRFTTPHDLIPRTQLLSNGRYAVMLTVAGSGYSRWRDVAIKIGRAHV